MEWLTAATHPDPYPLYAELRTRGGLIQEPDTGLWLATDADAVGQVLAHPACSVRPAEAPVPPVIQGTPAGDLFANLMRMNEGTRHRCPRHALMPLLTPIATPSMVSLADAFHADSIPRDRLARINAWTFEFPLFAVASRLGLGSAPPTWLAGLVDDFVACLSPLSSGAQLDAAQSAAERLRQHVRASSAGSLPDCRTDAAEVRLRGTQHDHEALRDNLVGLLSQTYEATAGLIGNALIQACAMARRGTNATGLGPKARHLVTETLRYDPPVQNTRRFVTRTCQVAGRELSAGSSIVVLLAAANRDPAIHHAPDTFKLDRNSDRIFSFGDGRHACPGRELALDIATQALTRLIDRDVLPALPALRWRYRPSLNGRIPQFTAT